MSGSGSTRVKLTVRECYHDRGMQSLPESNSQKPSDLVLKIGLSESKVRIVDEEFKK